MSFVWILRTKCVVRKSDKVWIYHKIIIHLSFPQNLPGAVLHRVKDQISETFQVQTIVLFFFWIFFITLLWLIKVKASVKPCCERMSPDVLNVSGKEKKRSIRGKSLREQSEGDLKRGWCAKVKEMFHGKWNMVRCVEKNHKLGARGRDTGEQIMRDEHWQPTTRKM